MAVVPFVQRDLAGKMTESEKKRVQREGDGISGVGYGGFVDTCEIARKRRDSKKDRKHITSFHVVFSSYV